MKGMRYMKIFEILDKENRNSVGVLLYYEKKKEFIIELEEYLDEWTAPLLFTNLVKRNIYTVPRDLSFLWVKERIIPCGRQNIGAILKNHKMESYDEMRFLELSKGKCSQDGLYIKMIDKLPEYIKERQNRNIKECVVCDEKKILCFFVDDTVKKIDLEKIDSDKNSIMYDIQKVLGNDKLYQSCCVGTGGYSITFNDSIDIPAYILYDAGESISLSLNDFICFAKNNLLDTSACCSLLDCSRQNISYIVKQEYLKPIKEDIKGNLYLKGETVKNMW